MSIFEYNEEEHIRNERETAYERGMEKGMEKGIAMFILDNREEKILEDRICEKLMKRFELTEEKARIYLNMCVKGRE